MMPIVSNKTNTSFYLVFNYLMLKVIMQKNFGELKYIIKEFVADGIAAKIDINKRLLKDFVTLLKENEILKKEFLVYNNIEGKVSESEAYISEYIKENIKIMEAYTSKQIDEANGILAKMVATINTEYPKNPLSQLHESIHTLMVNKVNIMTIEKRVNATGVITEHIKTNTPKVKVADRLLPNSMVSDILKERFNKKYSNLDGDTKRVLNSVISANKDTREGIMVGLVRECVDLVDVSLKESSGEIKEKLLSTKDRLLRLKYHNDTYIIEVGKLLDLKNTLT